jgi:hypothetical protein
MRAPSAGEMLIPDEAPVIRIGPRMREIAMKTRIQVAKPVAGVVALVLAMALTLSACGSSDATDESTTTASAEPITLDGLTGCFEDAAQKVRKIKVSFSKRPPDAEVSGPSGSAYLWVGADEAALEKVKKNERKMDYGPGVDVDDLFVQSGNALAELSPDASPVYMDVLEGCLPTA